MEASGRAALRLTGASQPRWIRSGPAVSLPDLDYLPPVLLLPTLAPQCCQTDPCKHRSGHVTSLKGWPSLQDQCPGPHGVIPSEHSRVAATCQALGRKCPAPSDPPPHPGHGQTGGGFGPLPSKADSLDRAPPVATRNGPSFIGPRRADAGPWSHRGSKPRGRPIPPAMQQQEISHMVCGAGNMAPGAGVYMRAVSTAHGS